MGKYPDAARRLGLVLLQVSKCILSILSNNSKVIQLRLLNFDWASLRHCGTQVLSLMAHVQTSHAHLARTVVRVSTASGRPKNANQSSFSLRLFTLAAAYSLQATFRPMNVTIGAHVFSVIRVQLRDKNHGHYCKSYVDAREPVLGFVRERGRVDFGRVPIGCIRGSSNG